MPAFSGSTSIRNEDPPVFAIAAPDNPANAKIVNAIDVWFGACI
ncbi:hypothetical protein [Bradyrhizobium sp. S69]|nr:hypothetical protein [Bradyrhizobium sp. S69]